MTRFARGTWVISKDDGRIGLVGLRPAGYKPPEPRGWTRVQFIKSTDGEDVRTSALRAATAAEIKRAKAALAPPKPKPPRHRPAAADPLAPWRKMVELYALLRNDASCLRADPRAEFNGSLSRASAIAGTAEFLRDKALWMAETEGGEGIKGPLFIAFEEARSRTAF